METILLPFSEFDDSNTKKYPVAHEYKVEAIALRDCPVNQSDSPCDTPERAVAYWRLHIASHAHFDSEKEMLVALFLNSKMRVKGHTVVGIGTLDSVLTMPREIFRCAIVIAARRILIMHNHPSGDPSPSESDIKMTRDLIRAGNLLKIELVDHVIVGDPDHVSLRDQGYFYA